MGFPHRRRLVTLLDVGLMASGGGPIEPPIGDMDGLGVWYRADHGLYTNTAANFASVNAEQLTIPINPSLATAPGAWTWGGWVWFDVQTVAEVMSSGNWRFYSDGVQVRASVGGSGGYKEAYSPGMGVGTWYFLLAGYRPEDGGQLYVFGNDTVGGAWITGAVGTVSPITSGTMHFGNGFSGRLQGWFQFNRELTAAERTFLYNAGVGRRFDELSAAFKVGLQGWWPMNEASGSRRDLSGNNNTLTDVNTVLSAPGKVPDQAAFGPVGYWEDSGPNHFDLTQATAGSQPVLVANARNSKSVVRFDGTDYMFTPASIVGGSLAGAQAQSVFCVQKQAAGVNATHHSWGAVATNMLVGHWGIGGLLIYDSGSGAPPTGRVSTAQPEPWQGTWHLIEAVRDGVNGSLTIEGNPLVTSSTLTGTFNTAESRNLYVGAHFSDLVTYNLQGDIAELIIFNRTLTAGECDTVRNYLKLKWGIAQNKLMLNPSGTGYLQLNPATNDRLALN